MRVRLNLATKPLESHRRFLQDQGYKEVKRVLDGLGIAILSTSRGVMSDRQAKKAKVGGEILCTVW